MNTRNEIEIFKFENLGDVRIKLDEKGEPWFCLTDICGILGTNKTADIMKRLDTKGVDTIDTLTNGGIQRLLYVDEFNLYEIIFTSRKPIAMRFKEWVKGVIYEIRTKGYYGISNFRKIYENDPSAMSDMLRIAADAVEENMMLKLEAEKNKPKLEKFDRMMESKTTLCMTTVANILAFKKIGRNKLFRILVENGIFYRDQYGKAHPTAMYVNEFEYFKVVELEYKGKDGKIYIGTQIQSSQKGIAFIRDLLLSLGYKECTFDEPVYTIVG